MKLGDGKGGERASAARARAAARGELRVGCARWQQLTGSEPMRRGSGGGVGVGAIEGVCGGVLDVGSVGGGGGGLAAAVAPRARGRAAAGGGEEAAARAVIICGEEKG